MDDLERALNSIGKKSFIDYYDDYKCSLDKNELAKRLLNENRKATSLEAQKTRIRKAEWIFENNLEESALNIILNSKRIDSMTRRKAEELLRKTLIDNKKR